MKKVFSVCLLASLLGMMIIVFGSAGKKYEDILQVRSFMEQGDTAVSVPVPSFPNSQSYTDYQDSVSARLNVANYAVPAYKKEVSHWESTIKSLENFLESFTNSDDILFRGFFKESKMALNHFLGMDSISSMYPGEGKMPWETVYYTFMENGQLGAVLPESDITANCNQLVSFAMEMQEQGRSFVYVGVPGKFGSNGVLKDFSESIRSQRDRILVQYGIQYVDIEQILRSEGFSDQDIFFNTDHHWKPQYGIYADYLLCNYLNQNLGYNIDLEYFGESQYQAEILPKAFLGSIGKKMTRYYIEPDDFIVYTPKYESNLTVQINDKQRTGKIEDVLCNKDIVEHSKLKDLYYGAYYSYYGYGDQAFIHSHNNSLHDGSNILLIKTSFADCMYPYLANAAEDLTVIDMRQYTGSLHGLIAEVNPDTVIFLSGLNSFLPSPSKEGGTFDLR